MIFVQKGFLANIDSDVKSLCVKILKSAQKDAPLESNGEVRLNWDFLITFIS